MYSCNVVSVPDLEDMANVQPRWRRLADKRNVEDSKTIRARVQAARERQLERFKGTKLTCNAEIGPTELREFCRPMPPGRSC